MLSCIHSRGVRKPLVKPRTPEGCEECLKDGTHWVHLRLCLDCGHVGCCDSSIGKHATKHFEATRHTMMTAFPGMEWNWCYVHRDYIDQLGKTE
ncbi:MAG: UBP-type zinc finger domain-containing protein [Candidatus Micrarchaeota archaeon]|nr:UBP-type zinc finger domain-containing protein [Candidatus Micrarchaeota archaeon]